MSDPKEENTDATGTLWTSFANTSATNTDGTYIIEDCACGCENEEECHSNGDCDGV